MNQKQQQPILVLGANGNTGRRVAARLQAANYPTRLGSRNGSPAFDWNRPESWDACLDGVGAVYINYPSDLAIPGSTATLAAFVDAAVRNRVGRLVLLTGRGEAECLRWEEAVKESGLQWTIVRSAWFNQNFTEGGFREMVDAGALALPAGERVEPFVDLEDLADVVTAALTEEGHAGEVYEVTGPELLSFGQVAAALSRGLGRSVEYVPISQEAFVAGMTEAGLPEPVIWTMDHLFTEVLDGRNAWVGDGVQRALGRQPVEFGASDAFGAFGAAATS